MSDSRMNHSFEPILVEDSVETTTFYQRLATLLLLSKYYIELIGKFDVRINFDRPKYIFAYNYVHVNKQYSLNKININTRIQSPNPI